MDAVPKEQIGFRNYEQKDLEDATRLAWDAWARPGEEETQSQEEAVDPRVMQGYVSSFLIRSNWNEVAYDDHGVVGVLFGRIDRLPGIPGGLRRGLRELGLLPGFLFNRYGPGAIAPAVVLQFFLTEFKVLLNKPRADAEINLIVVDSKHQRKGLGRALVERFVQVASESGCRMVTLYTDNQVSNWRFYEIMGFKRIATFNDGLTGYFTETDAKGIVYALDLTGPKGAAFKPVRDLRA